MTDGWPTRSLGELCHVIGGGTPPKSNPGYYNGTIPWATVRDMQQDTLEATEHQITHEAVASSSTNVIPSGNVVIATRVGLGKVCILGQDTAINQDLRGVVPINEGVLSARYLFWWFKSVASVIVAEGTGATVQGVKLSFIKGLRIPLPTLVEQQRIVRLLDEAFDGIAIAKANVEKNLLNARALFRGYLNSAFLEDNNHWQAKDFEDCIQPVQYTRKVQRKQFLSEGKFPIISQEADFNNGFWNDKADLFEVVRPVVIFGDHTRVLKYVDFSFVLGADGVRILSPHEFLNPKFFYYQLLGTDIRSLGYSRHYRLLKEIKIRFPSLEEQARVVSRLDEIAHQSQKLAETYAQKLAALELLRESILGQSLMDSLKAA